LAKCVEGQNRGNQLFWEAKESATVPEKAPEGRMMIARRQSGKTFFIMRVAVFQRNPSSKKQ
jgi:hypothetical protein